jgi:hypothetical protein
VAGQIAAVPEPTQAQAEAIDAELIEDGRPPEGRFTAPAAILGRNLANGHTEDALPGPEETAPLPEGWESSREQAQTRPEDVPDQDDRNTISDGVGARTEPRSLAGRLQEAAARTAVEDKLIRAIDRARSVADLKDLHQRATAAGYWSDRVRNAATARKVALTEGMLSR